MGFLLTRCDNTVRDTAPVWANTLIKVWSSTLGRQAELLNNCAMILNGAACFIWNFLNRLLLLWYIMNYARLHNNLVTFLNMNFFLFMLLLVNLLNLLYLLEFNQSLVYLILNFASSRESFIKFLFVGVLLLLGHLNPFFPSVSFIETSPNLTVRKNVNSIVLLLASSPVTKVGPTVNPHIDTKAILLILRVLTMIHPAILPLIGTLSVHHVILPLTNIDSPVVPEVDAIPWDGVVLPVS